MESNKAQQKTQKIPKLRFPGFSGVWEKKKFSEIIRTRPTKNYQIKNSEFLNHGIYRVVDQGQKLVAGYSNNDTKVFHDVPVIIFGDHTTILKYVNFAFVVGADGTKVLESKSNDSFKFIFYQLKSNPIKSEGYKRHFNILKSRIFLLPELSEQQKIADFLSVTDEWLENLRDQKENLEAYKKGMMQKIFSRQIRFKDENGKDFPEWEERKLEDVAEVYQSSTISQSDLSDTEGYDVWGANGKIGKFSRYNHENSQIAVTCRGSTCGLVNLTTPFSWITGNAMVVNVDDNLKFVSKIFLFYYLKNDNLRYLISGSGQPQITGNIKNHKINLPTLAEQERVADFLSSLDNLIESKQQQINQAEKWKNGLMQELFV